MLFPIDCIKTMVIVSDKYLYYDKIKILAKLMDAWKQLAVRTTLDLAIKNFISVYNMQRESLTTQTRDNNIASASMNQWPNTWLGDNILQCLQFAWKF